MLVFVPPTFRPMHRPTPNRQKTGPLAKGLGKHTEEQSAQSSDVALQSRFRQ